MHGERVIPPSCLLPPGSAAQFETGPPSLKPRVCLRRIDSCCVLQWLFMCLWQQRWVLRRSPMLLPKQKAPLSGGRARFTVKCWLRLFLVVVVTTLSANGILEMVCLTGLIFVHCAAQMDSIGPPLGLCLREKSFFWGPLAFRSIVGLLRFVLILFGSVWFWNTVFHYLVLRALLS